MLVDCGASSLIGLKRLDIEPHSIDAVLVSHLHGDHFAGIPFLVLDQQFARRERPLRVVGPPGLRDRLVQAMEVLFPGSSAVARRFELEMDELTAVAPLSVGAAEVRPVEVVHPSGAPAYGLRIQCGDRLVAYSGDTEWTDNLLALSAGADLFICEAYTFEREIKYHLSFRALQRRRAELGCLRLVLTHTGPDLLAHRADVDAEIAEDGYQIEL
jgi:ribonuclease BN (tRNA processing enzyme)